MNQTIPIKPDNATIAALTDVFKAKASTTLINRDPLPPGNFEAEALAAEWRENQGRHYISVSFRVTARGEAHDGRRLWLSLDPTNARQLGYVKHCFHELGYGDPAAAMTIADSLKPGRIYDLDVTFYTLTKGEKKGEQRNGINGITFKRELPAVAGTVDPATVIATPTKTPSAEETLAQLEAMEGKATAKAAA